jgi:hypothetical protein
VRILAALWLAAALGCGELTSPEASPTTRVLVVGIDGLEWSVLRPLLAEGRCPNLRALMERGSFGRLATLSRTLSPVVWTSIATGKLPRDHGIQDFLDAQGHEYTSARRAVPALWNIADRYGLSINMFGWFVTWPVEPIRGVAITGSSSAAPVDDNWKPALLPGVERQVHPPALEGRVMAIAAQAGSLERVAELSREKVFGPIPAGLLDEDQQKVMQQTLWSLQSDETYYQIARTLIAEQPADLALIYFGGTDVVGHRYWRQYEPEPYRWSGDEQADEALSRVIPSYYEWVDEMLGGLLEAAGADVTVFVISDHGMHAVSTDAPNELHVTGHHQDATPGVIVAAGPGIVEQGGLAMFLSTGALPQHGSVVDVAPTILALLGIPVGRDMAGRAYQPMLAPGPALENARGLPPVESHDEGFRPPEMVLMPPEMGDNFKAKFGALGYLDLPADDEEARVVIPEEGR